MIKAIVMRLGLLAFFGILASANSVAKADDQMMPPFNRTPYMQPSNTSDVPHPLGTLGPDEIMPQHPGDAMMDDSSMHQQHSGNIAYITGGIGDEERSTLDMVKKDYNLHVTNADRTGAFTGATRVAIFDDKGKEMLNVSVGPLLYVNLPAGNYMIQATSDDETKKLHIRVGNQKPVSVHLSW